MGAFHYNWLHLLDNYRPAVTGKHNLRAAWAGGWVGGWRGWRVEKKASFTTRGCYCKSIVLTSMMQNEIEPCVYACNC